MFTVIYRNTFESNSTICQRFRSNSVPVNGKDGGGNVSITAGLVLNELGMYLLSVFVCSTGQVRKSVLLLSMKMHKCWRGKKETELKEKVNTVSI